MMNQDKPVDYVVASGETHSIREFVELAFSAVGMYGEWVQSGVDEKYVLFSSSNGVRISTCVSPSERIVLVKINPQFYRPAEVDVLIGDSTKIREELGWKPKVNFKELVNKMVKNDLA